MQGFAGGYFTTRREACHAGFCRDLPYHLPRGLPCRVLPGATLPPTARLTIQGFAGGYFTTYREAYHAGFAGGYFTTYREAYHAGFLLWSTLPPTARLTMQGFAGGYFTTYREAYHAGFCRWRVRATILSPSSKP